AGSWPRRWRRARSRSGCCASDSRRRAVRGCSIAWCCWRGGEGARGSAALEEIPDDIALFRCRADRVRPALQHELTDERQPMRACGGEKLGAIEDPGNIFAHVSREMRPL